MTKVGHPDSGPDGQQRRARAVVVTRTVATLFVIAMLGFGLVPIVDGLLADRPMWTLVAGGVAFSVLASAFAGLVRQSMRRPWRGLAVRQAGVIVGLVVLLPPFVDAGWHIMGFLGVAALSVTLRPRHGLPAAAAFLAVVTVERWQLGVPATAFFTLQDVLTGAALAGIIVMVAFVEELFAARAELARAAVAAERHRFARDLHDTLGHNLSAIALKSDLARRLLTADPGRARSELDGVHTLAGTSLQDVRAVVKGYRRVSLANEIQGVRSVLESAGVHCQVSSLTDPLPAPVEDVLAWAVREAATNLLRHSVPTKCDINLTTQRSEIRLAVTNDGAGLTVPDTGGGSGLIGLTERLAPLGGALSAGARPGGEFALTVHIPTTPGSTT